MGKSKKKELTWYSWIGVLSVLWLFGYGLYEVLMWLWVSNVWVFGGVAALGFSMLVSMVYELLKRVKKGVKKL